MMPLAVSPAYDPAAWDSFATAEVTAAAALAGLLVVAISINISRILQLPPVVARLGGTLAMFTGILLAGTFLLVPGQARVAVGVEIAVVGAGTTALVYSLRGMAGVDPKFREVTIQSAVMGVTAGGCLTLAGLFCAIGIVGGLYWLVPAIVVGFVFGLGNSWVALVEILR